MSPKQELPRYRLQLCVFDSQRDYPEGQEAQRILAYYPKDCPVDEQTAVVGLAEALVTFANNFDQASALSAHVSPVTARGVHRRSLHVYTDRGLRELAC